MKQENEQWFVNFQAFMDDETTKREAGDKIAMAKLAQVQGDVLDNAHGLIRISAEQIREEFRKAVDKCTTDKEGMVNMEVLANQLVEKCNDVEMKVEKCKEFQMQQKKWQTDLRQRQTLRICENKSEPTKDV